jgi:hypothetical protein
MEILAELRIVMEDLKRLSKVHDMGVLLFYDTEYTRANRARRSTVTTNMHNYTAATAAERFCWSYSTTNRD